MNPFIDVLWERLDHKTIVLLCGLAQAISITFNCHNFSLWTIVWAIIAHKWYSTRLGNMITKSFVDVSTELQTTVQKISTDIVTDLSLKVKEGTENVASGFKNAGETVGDFSLSNLGKEALKHSLGISLCAKSVLDAPNVGAVIMETGKIASMCGLEYSVVSAGLSKLSTLTSESLSPLISQHGLMEEAEKFIPLVSSLAAMADIDIAGIDASVRLDKVSKNIRNSKAIASEVRRVLESTGLITGTHFSLIQELNESVVSLKNDFMWISQTLVINGAEFLRPDSYKRVLEFKKEVTAISAKIRSINIPEIKNNQIVTECNTIIWKSVDLLNQIEIIRSTNGFRPVPVGVCIKGPSGFGKSTMIPQLCEKVKAKLQQHQNVFGDTKQWTRWDANQREEYDSGYIGQEIVYMDDAFQDKTNEDHMMWYSYISPTCVGTIQAAVEHKGSPFRAMLCITTCNNFPKTSIKVNCIEALWGRFPITVEVGMKAGATMPKVYDPEFSHLEMKHGTMQDHCSGSDLTGRMPIIDLDGLCTLIVDQMLDNYTLFEQKRLAIPMQVTDEHADLEDIPEETPLQRLETYLTGPFLDAPDDGSVDSDEDAQSVDFDDATRLEHIRHLGTANSRAPIARWETAVCQNLETVLNQDVRHTVFNLGEWTRYLRRRRTGGHQRWSPTLYPGQHGLYAAITSLGSWFVPNEFQERFKVAFSQQSFLVVESELGDRYLWSPYLANGTVLFLDSPEFRNDLRVRLLSPWRRRIEQWKASVASVLQDRRVLRFAARSVIPLSIEWAFPVIGFICASRRVENFFIEVQRIPMWWRDHDQSWYSPLNLGLGTLHLVAAPMRLVCKSFEYLDKILVRITQGMRGTLLNILEWLGVDVTPLWTEIADLSATIISDAITIAIAGALCYCVYRLIVLLTQKPITPHSKNEYGKGGKKAKQEKKKNEKKVVVRPLTLRGELCCAELCSEENVLVETEEEPWIKYGPCKGLSVYDADYLGYICDKVEECADVVIENQERSHCAMKFSEGEDFYLEESYFSGAWKLLYTTSSREVPVIEMKMCLVGDVSKIQAQYEEFMEFFKAKRIQDWSAKISVRYFEEDNVYMIKIKILCLNTSIQGVVGRFVNKDLKDLRVISERISKRKILGDENIRDIISEQGIVESSEYLKNIVKKHQVWISKVPFGDWDTPNRGANTHGVGHLDKIVLNAHMFEMDDIVRFQPYHRQGANELYFACKIIKKDLTRDIAVAQILKKSDVQAHCVKNNIVGKMNRLASISERFQSLIPYLCDEKSWRDLVMDRPVCMHLPKTGFFAKGRASFQGVRNYCFTDGDSGDRDYLVINELNINSDVASNGDCGGIIISHDSRRECKVVAIHSGGNSSFTTASLLRKEDLDLLSQHGSYEDPWDRLIVPGTPTDLPNGTQVEFMGKYFGRTKPANNKSQVHWKRTPWSSVFVEQLQPSCLDAYDPRIKEELPTNEDNIRTLLMKPNSIMCSELPGMDMEILQEIEDQMTDEMVLLIPHIVKLGDNLEDVLEVGLNGHVTNTFVKNMDINKASGVPLNELENSAKKSDFLDNNEGHVSFKDNSKGKLLKNRVITKLVMARTGRRIKSFAVSKVKDELQKLSAIEKGRSRVFHCVGCDKIIFDSCLMGNFKESYMRASLDCNHAIGINPHSIGWKSIYQKLNKHPNVFDLDFSNFDKHLHSEIMHCAFRIMRRTIQQKAPDNWDAAREILEEESIETFVIDYETVYKTKRGNKSGEYLTTVLNCICNDILSFYTWIVTTGLRDIAEFRKNVSLVTFGDDKCESVSDEFAEKYNYFSAKEVMSGIGHIITPGAKDGIEAKFCGISNLQFLKRGFVVMDNLVLAPLLTRSIESPFVWTQTDDTEVVIWRNLVEQSLYEACLHGEEYFEEFRNKLRNGENHFLLKELSGMLSLSYQKVLAKYSLVWFNHKTHLDDE